MLFWAILEDDNGLEKMRLLVEAGADVDAKDDNGHPMLFWAILEDDNGLEKVRLLVEAGADVNAKDDSGNSMLVWALIEDNLEIIQILVDAGAKR